MPERIDANGVCLRYSPTFLVPVTLTSNNSTKYISTSMLGALSLTGRVVGQDEAEAAQTLDVIVRKAAKPLVMMVEGTTSNNVRDYSLGEP